MHALKVLALLFGAFGLLAMAADATENEAAVELELILAVDTSGSMGGADLLVQRQGYVAALRDPQIIAAIASRGAVAVAYLEWAGAEEQRIIVPWTILSGGPEAHRFADRLAATPLDPGFRSGPRNHGTSISKALLFASEMFTTGRAQKIIDISGDGPNNAGPGIAPIRDQLIARDVTINGHPIALPRHGQELLQRL